MLCGGLASSRAGLGSMRSQPTELLMPLINNVFLGSVLRSSAPLLAKLKQRLAENRSL
jgi:hypothetical protein